MAFAEVADVIRRLDDDPDERMTAHIEAALDDATDMARDIGHVGWTDETVPAPVRRVVAAAVARFIRNPDGFETSRAADETVAWRDASNVLEFTANEEARIRRCATPYMSGFGTVEVHAWGTRHVADDVIRVPWAFQPDYKPMPLIAINDVQGVYRGPWG